MGGLGLTAPTATPGATPTAPGKAGGGREAVREERFEFAWCGAHGVCARELKDADEPHMQLLASVPVSVVNPSTAATLRVLCSVKHEEDPARLYHQRLVTKLTAMVRAVVGWSSARMDSTLWLPFGPCTKGPDQSQQQTGGGGAVAQGILAELPSPAAEPLPVRVAANYSGRTARRGSRSRPRFVRVISVVPTVCNLSQILQALNSGPREQAGGKAEPKEEDTKGGLAAVQLRVSPPLNASSFRGHCGHPREALEGVQVRAMPKPSPRL